MTEVSACFAAYTETPPDQGKRGPFIPADDVGSRPVSARTCPTRVQTSEAQHNGRSSHGGRAADASLWNAVLRRKDRSSSPFSQPLHDGHQHGCTAECTARPRLGQRSAIWRVPTVGPLSERSSTPGRVRTRWSRRSHPGPSGPPGSAPRGNGAHDRCAPDRPRPSPAACRQRVGSMDALDDERLALQLDFAGDLGPETTVSGRDAACFQRPPKGASQSAPGSCDQIVERGRIRREILGCHAIVLRYRTVDAKRDRLVTPRQLRGPQRPTLSDDRHPRRVCDLSSRSSPISTRPCT